MTHAKTFVAQTISLLFSRHVVLSFTFAAACIATIDNALSAQASTPTGAPHTRRQSESIRFATFNVSMNRRNEGELTEELKSGVSEQIAKVAAIIQAVRPDVVLLNEIDYDGGKSLQAFEKNFLSKPQLGQDPIRYQYRFVGPVNTGVDTKMDVDNDGKEGGPNDAFGFGFFPGQYGMAVLSKYPIDTNRLRTFQKFLWQDMPDAMLPTDPVSAKPWYSAEVTNQFRLSSKSHWDVPIKLGSRHVHFLVSHPTPPVFDGDEDRNGKRNHDEIRMWADYVGQKADYLYDDNGIKGGLAADQSFIIAGDLNADPNDGDSTEKAVSQLIDHPRVANEPIPVSKGGPHYSSMDGKINAEHTGDASHDTADFNDENVGNVRIDYVLPSKDLKVTNQGIFWPVPSEPGSDWVKASDHRMVWIDIEIIK